MGRFVLWAALGLVMFRGVSDMVGGSASRPSPAQATAQVLPADVSWPGLDARAFAEEFAAEYLSWSVGDETVGRRLAPYLGAGLEEDLGLVPPREGGPRTVRAMVATEVLAHDENHALVTVAASTSAGPVRLTVPVARDQTGGFAVYDYPSLAEPRPAGLSTGTEGPGDVKELVSVDPAVEDIVERFMAAYLAGRDHDLAVLLAPNTSVTALRGRHDLMDVVRLRQIGPAAPASLTVLATVRAREHRSGLELTLGYRLRLHLGDRWSVAAIDSTP